MILKCFTVFDTKAGLFLQPFFMRTVGEAVRGFAELVTNPEHDFCRHARDFALYELGEYSEQSGGILAHQEPQRIVGARELLEEYGVRGFDVLPVPEAEPAEEDERPLFMQVGDPERKIS